MEESRMKKHVTVVGAIQVGAGILGFIGALTVFFALNFAKGMVGDDDVPTVVLSFLSICLPILIGFMATLSLVGGIALLSFRSWARILVMIVSVMGCFFIPIGTLIGVYSIWTLMQDDTIKLFKPQP
jgi:hypothetical protein